MSSWLQDFGTAPGAPIPALLEPSAEALALVLGGMAAERPLAPLNTRSTPAELEAVLSGVGSGPLVCDPASADLAAAVAGAEIAVIEDLGAAGEPAAAETESADQTTIVLHTSGTTGHPKAVYFSDRVMAARARTFAAAVDLRPGDRYVSPALFHHIAGIGAHLASLAVGAAVIPMPHFSLEVWRQTLDLEPTHVLLVPSVIESLLAEGELRGGMRTLIYGAAPIRPETLRRLLAALPDVAVVQLFGQTEGSPLTRLSHADHVRALAAEDRLLGSVGRALPEVEIRLEGTDEDGIGEVLARAEHLGAPDSDGWLRTGDLGELREDYLYLRGRRGDRIIRGGENLLPLEVEQVLGQHPGVREAAVVGRPDDRLGEVPWAFVVASSQAPDPAELRAFVRERLAGFKVPVGLTFVAELPRNASGKVLRRRLSPP